MVAINHALTGAIIGLSIANPLVAIPLAIASHFVLDAVPHFGVRGNKWLRSKTFRNMIIADGVLCLGLVLVLGISQPSHWLLAAICAFAAASPDLLHLNHYYKIKQHLQWRPNLYSRFASGIQRFERPSGAFALVEAMWFVAALIGLRVFI